MPKICVIADTHTHHRLLKIPPCDILIHCGDMCSFQQGDLAVLKDIDSWFGEIPAKHVICIAGNHDFPLENKSYKFSNATYLQDSLINIEGLAIYGSPWCPDLINFAFYADNKALYQAWKKIPESTDILVTHTPPESLLDVPSNGRVHLGCPLLSAELSRISPAYHLFGHIHASAGEKVKDGIHYINAAIVGGKDFGVINSPKTFNI